MHVYLRSFSYIKPYLWQFFLCLFLALLFATASVFFIPLSRDLISQYSSGDFARISNQVLNAIVLFGLRILVQYIQFYFMSNIGNLVLIDLRKALFVRFLELPQLFYSDWKMGDILTRMFDDTGRVRDLIIQIFSDFLPQFVSFVGIVVYLFVINWKLMVFSLVAIPVFVGIISVSANRTKRNSAKVQKKAADVIHIAQEVIGNVKAVQSNTMEGFEAKRYYSENFASYRSTMVGVAIRLKSEPLISFLQFVLIGLVLWYGGYEMSIGQMTGAELGAFFAGIMLLIDPTLAVSKVYNQLSQNVASCERVYEILDYPNPIQNAANPRFPDQINGEVVFENVDFWYETEDKKALKNLDLCVAPGEVIALVGASGAGKSTLIHLIPRFYDVRSGVIKIDGVPVQEMDLHFLRSHIGIVPQEDVLFRGSVLENVRYGRQGATQDEVEEAIRLANAWEFVEALPGGIHARIGDRGRKLSGGQKQRLSIARAILRNPKILILDEATSALDSKSEQLVQDALKRLMQNRTTFVIAHRLSTITHADRIVVMDGGEIKEIGTHSQLLARQGLYEKLYTLQYKNQS